MPTMKLRAQRYVMTFVLGQATLYWWSAIFTLGMGFAFLAAPLENLPSLPDDVPLFKEGGVNKVLLGLCLILCALLSLDGLHTRRRWLLATSNLLIAAIMLWLATCFAVATPAPAVATWVTLSHAFLQGLIFVQVRNRMLKW